MTEGILSVIPARKGSKGIPRKNVRELDDRPLVGHAIETSKASNLIETVLVTTDSPEISQIARRFDADILVDRPEELATDDVPLAPVVEHAYEGAGEGFDYVLCFQPTVPLIRPESIDAGIEKGVNSDSDSVIFVNDQTHHYWKETDEGFVPVSSDRKNRQLMDRIYSEIGVFLSRQDVVGSGERVGENPAFHVVDEREGIDIDTYVDWLTAENSFGRKQLLYRVTGNEQTGTGHVFRGITIADHLFEHDITFAVSPKDTIAIDKLEESNYEYHVFEDDESFISHVETTSPFVVVNDVLDTSAEYMRDLQATGVRTVNFEDLGDGTQYADAVVNALFEHSNPPPNHYYGFEYFCLRGEFRYANKNKRIQSINQIMVSFGGTDQNNLTATTLRALSSLDYDLYIDVVLGLGYSNRDSLDSIIDELPENITIEINKNVQSMAERMEEADLLITSNGRTLYEAGSLNLPVISIAQNSREQKHPYAHVSRGVLSLGYAEYASVPMIRDAVNDYITDGEKRETMRQALSEHDIANGIERIKRIIFDENDEDQ